MKAIYLTETKELQRKVFDKCVREKIATLFDIKDVCYNKEALLKGDFEDVEYIFGTWGFPPLTEEEIKKIFPSLKAVFYAAGTVQAFARPFLNLGIRLFSAWQANAIPVAEYAVSQILLASKGYFHLSVHARSDYKAAHERMSTFPGNYNAKIGVLGYGAIAKIVIRELLKHNEEIYVYAPNITNEEAKKLGIHKATTLEEIFDKCNVISNHVANLPATHKMINKDIINRLKDDQTFINTGRGQQVDEVALLEKCKNNPNIFAVLDVTDPEPPAQNSLYFKLPNVIVTPHIAGSSGNEVVRMAEFMYEAAKKVLKKEPCNYEVTMKMLELMA